MCIERNVPSVKLSAFWLLLYFFPGWSKIPFILFPQKKEKNYMLNLHSAPLRSKKNVTMRRKYETYITCSSLHEFEFLSTTKIWLVKDIICKRRKWIPNFWNVGYLLHFFIRSFKYVCFENWNIRIHGWYYEQFVPYFLLNQQHDLFVFPQTLI